MPSDQPSPRPLLSGRTVLVVEDSAVQRAHAVAMMRELGAAEVLEAGDGQEGLGRLAQAAAIDLVLTDLDMPSMDGIAFIGAFAALGFRPQVVILSSQEASVLQSVGLMAETYGLTVPGIITKPLTLAGLLPLLKAHPRLPPSPAPKAPPSGPAGPGPSQGEIAKGLLEGEFLCHFQPQVTFQGALLKGVEALVRWRHPGLGLLGPAAFLPQAEANDELMTALTLAVLAYSADQWHRWRRKGFQVGISVNLSARSISTAGFADLLMAQTERLGLPPKALAFELTESASVSNLGQTLENLARLRMRGYHLSIDDFGTGYATFEQLERIPFTELKLDRSIVSHLPMSERHAVVARNLVQMAKGLNLATVAEGVETLATWRALVAMGCECCQGYLVARPMPGEQLLGWAGQDRALLR